MFIQAYFINVIFDSPVNNNNYNADKINILLHQNN